MTNLYIQKVKDSIDQNKLISISFYIRLAFLIFCEIHDSYY